MGVIASKEGVGGQFQKLEKKKGSCKSVIES